MEQPSPRQPEQAKHVITVGAFLKWRLDMCLLLCPTSYIAIVECTRHTLYIAYSHMATRVCSLQDDIDTVFPSSSERLKLAWGSAQSNTHIVEERIQYRD